MSIVYDIFQGDAAGGPIDYTTAIATVSGLTWTGPALDPGTTTQFGVRARDDVSGLDDGNTDAAVTVVVAADGTDATAAPVAVAAVQAASLAAGAVRLAWTYPVTTGPAPSGFRIFKGPQAGPVDFATVLADVPYSQGLGLVVGSLATPFAATLDASAGLTDGTTYQFAIAAYNAQGQGPALMVTGTSDATAPANPINLTATAV